MLKRESMENKTDNELIAEFMDAIAKREDNLLLLPRNVPITGWYRAEQLKYYTSWDWLMPVVQKISKIHDSTFHYDVDKIRNGEWPNDNQYMDVIALPLSTSINEVHKAV